MDYEALQYSEFEGSLRQSTRGPCQDAEFDGNVSLPQPDAEAVIFIFLQNIFYEKIKTF